MALSKPTTSAFHPLEGPEGLPSDTRDADHPLRGKCVLVVGINYAPEMTGIAPYTTGIAEYLVEYADTVTVLCGPPSYPAWRVKPTDRGWRREASVNGVKVVRLWHYVPRRQTGLRRAAYELSFGAHVVAARRSQHPDVVYAVVPSLAGAVAALSIARRYRAPLVVHVQDLMGKAAKQSGMSGGARLARLTAALESYLLRHATIVVIISEAFRPVVTALGAEPGNVRLLRNWTHIASARRERGAVRRDLGWDSEQTVALHTGNMGWKQDLGNIIEAAKLTTSNPKLLWVLMGDGSQRRELQAKAVGMPNLKILPPCDGDLYPDILAAADVLLLNERPSLGEMSLPGKLTSYFSAGVPIVAAVAANSASADEVRGLPFVSLVSPGDPAALAMACSDLSWIQDSKVDHHISSTPAPLRSAAGALAALDRILLELFQ